ncbi:MAG: transcription termination factor NusA [candidate division Zixibacteria bacterium]|nr:transcription termination factor NusA [candidate division Zixibacteria bacterium]MDH3935836.1 transcription termination factor NusA [candidate division Zixibacteria bacterium]MDH4035056.1 transcription termination factor NusA [candidate division Zixibacteria bacterium]
MPFDMVEAITMIAREKNLEFEAVLETLQAGLLAAAKKKYSFVDNITFKFDRKDNELVMIATKKVVEEASDPNMEITLGDAKEIDAEAEVGDEIDIYIDYELEFGRNAIASAKQTLVQKVREAERDRVYEEFVDKVGTLISGVVQQIDKGSVIVNLGRAEGVVPIKEQIPREKFRQGDRIRAYILDVQRESRGPQIVLSRVNNEFLRALFALEVPEIYEKVIEIRGIAREPGERAKVAVYSSDERIDPVGACVGIKGVRVQSIVRELNNERIDIVPFSSNSEMFVTRALAPARVVNIDVFELEGKMTVAVEDEKLSLAIGRNGQNARLASKLTGWKVNILSETEYDESKRREAEMLVPVGQLDGIGAKIEERLSQADISSVQRLATSQVEVLTKVPGIGEKSAEALIDKAKKFVRDLEREYTKRKKAEAKAKAAAKIDDGKMKAEDVFEDDTEFVTEVDDVLEATAPDMDDVEDEDETEVRIKKDIDD